MVLVCEDDKIKLASAWVTSSIYNACELSSVRSMNLSCWTTRLRPDQTCDLAGVHTHPYFTKADEGTMCHGLPITEALAIRYNNAGMEFTSGDNDNIQAAGVDGYLGVSDRSCMRASQSISIMLPRRVSTISGSCTATPLPHTEWENP